MTVYDQGAGRDERGPRSRIAEQLAEFHRVYELPISRTPTVQIPAGQDTLRQSLIEEEVDELRAAVTDRDLVGIADALADIVYVAYGTACVYGIDLDAVLTEVHSSNMTKLDAAGRPIRRADGKILKGPNFREPDIPRVLREQH